MSAIRWMSMVSVVAALVVALVSPVPSLAQAGPAAPQAYTVLVGYENEHQGVEVMNFFPGTVTIHTGDRVHWVANSNEIHTVSFGYAADSTLPDLLAPAALFGYPMPPDAPSPLVINPAAAIQVPVNGGLFTADANSGLMSQQPDSVHTFDLTFPEAGDYLYVCLVHGWQMSGMVRVVSSEAAIPSTSQSMAMGRQEIAAALAQVPAVMQKARQQIQPPVTNADGTKTFKVLMGYHEGSVDLLQFFPDKLVVRPGDTVVWEMSATNDAPHTVTFLNGTAAPDDFIPFPAGDDTVALYLSPEVLFPSQPGPDLTREGYYNSGVLLPIPGTSYSLPIGDVSPGPQPFLCLLHDESGMTGTLTVVPR